MDVLRKHWKACGLIIICLLQGIIFNILVVYTYESAEKSVDEEMNHKEVFIASCCISYCVAVMTVIYIILKVGGCLKKRNDPEENVTHQNESVDDENEYIEMAYMEYY